MNTDVNIELLPGERLDDLQHGKYRLILTDEDLHSTEQTVDGKKLTELAVTLDQPQTSLVIEYQMLS
jgi:hypothetical protein